MDYSNVINELNLMQQAYATLFSTINKLQFKGDEYLEELTLRQYMTILAILHLPVENTTINNVAKKLGTSKQNANRLVSSIEKKGYIVTVPSKFDKRALNINLTQSGETVMLQCSQKAIYLMADIFNKFSLEEIETLWNLLKKLYSYDGEEQDGFENVATLDSEKDYSELQQSVLQEFINRRNR